MIEKISKTKLIDIVCNAIQELEFSEYSHTCVLDYLNITEEEYKMFKDYIGD